MARTRDRSPSVDSPDPALVLKRLKTSHASSCSPVAEIAPVDDPTPRFAQDLFDHSNIARLNSDYTESGPFKYAVVEKLFQDDLLRKVKDECLGELNFTEKETDIYKVNQTGDLASLNFLPADQIEKLSNLLALRDALYSAQFRNFLRAVTGCGPLSGKKRDMSVNSYTRGCHLLNHDDVIGTRRVSYILYMPLPHYQLWQKDWGGALELYPARINEDGQPEPESIPSKSIPPSWNQFIFFEVQPGKSFHSVEEVVVGGEDEDGRQRLSISGWFHAAQEGEEGYVPETLQSTEVKSSREQLTSSSTIFKSYPEHDPEVLPDVSLSEDHVAFLAEFLNPVYLQPRTMKALSARFVEESSLELHSFLNSPLADALEPRLRDLDARDGLGESRPRRIPPHTAGTPVGPTVAHTSFPFPHSSSSSHSSASSSSTSLSVSSMPAPGTPGPPTATWTIKGPPHKWRYCTLAAPSTTRSASAVTPRAHASSVGEILRSLQDELFASPAFRAWLAIVTRLMPMRHAVEARRFRPGLDYTLATSEEEEARLDAVLGLTPEVRDIAGDEEAEPRGRGRMAVEKEVRGWQAAEWGGWECYMAPHNEEDDPAIYRSSTHKKHAVPPQTNAVASGSATPKAPDAKSYFSIDNRLASASLDATSSPNSSSDVHSPRSGGGSGGGTPMEEDPHGHHSDDEEEEEEDSTLLTVQPGYNRLLLVLRDERVMRFVKYVSAAAEGSRWDVCGEYEVGVVQEQEGDGEAASAAASD